MTASAGSAERSRASSIDTIPDELSAVVRRRLVVRVLAATILSLTALSLAGQVSRYYFGYGYIFGLVDFFYVNQEQNLPSWFSSVQLLFSAGLLAAIWWQEKMTSRPFARHWGWLCLIFVFLSMDEMASLHERTMEPLQRLTGGMPDGIWAPTWLIAGLAFTAVVAIAYLRFFFMCLTPEQRLRLAAAAVVFLSGAVIMEMVAGAVFFPHGYESWVEFEETFAYAVTTHVEEFLEMAGILLFIDFLLRRLERGPTVGIAFSSG
ncbi:MAG: hypothetical protein WD005_02260 [Haliea sp.]